MSEWVGKTPGEIPVEQHFADVVNYLHDIFGALEDIRGTLEDIREAVQAAQP